MLRAVFRFFRTGIKYGAVEARCAGLAPDLRDNIARFLEGVRKRFKLGLCKPHCCDRHENMCIAGSVAGHFILQRRQPGFCFFGATQ